MRTVGATGLATSGIAADRVLQRVVGALNSTLELREVLRLLGEATLEATGAARCTLFLLDQGVFTPAVALGMENEDLWRAFREMPDVTLDPEQARLFRRFRAVAIEDARSDPLIPRPWVDRFDLRSLVIVPLLAVGEPCGLMVVDYPTVRTFDADEVRLLEAIGQSAGVAVRNARLFEAERRRARLQEALARGAAALSQPLEPGFIAGRLAAAYTDLLGASCCAIGRMDYEEHQVVPILVSGYADPPPMPFTDFPRHVRRQVNASWQRGRPAALEFGDDPAFARLAGCAEQGAVKYLLVPMTTQERPSGVVLLGFPAGVRLDEEAKSAAETLANIAASALERHGLLGELARQVQQMDVLYRLSTALTEHADARVLVARLNELLTSRYRIAGLAFREPNMVRRLGGERLLPAERSMPPGASSVQLEEGLHAVPMRLGRRLVGTLRVHAPQLGRDDEAFLVALGSGVAEVASRGALRAALDAASRDRAVAAERDRMGADLHDTVGQLFVAIGLLARRQAEQLPDDSPVVERVLRLAELADGGKWELEQAIRALAFVPAERRGLLPALRALARSFESDSGISVLVESQGRPMRLTPAVERAMYRVANEALTNAWRHARCSFVRLELDFTANEIALRITDDGVGLSPRLRDRGPGLGIMSMRRAIAQVDGILHVRNAARHGVRVEAKVAIP